MSESPRQETANGTQLSLKRKEEAGEGTPESTTEKALQALDAFLADMGAQSTALRKGEISGVRMPPALGSGPVATASKAAGGDSTAHKAGKREGGKMKSAGQSAAKRAKGGGPGVKQGGRGSARSVTGGMGLINARVLIKFDVEGAPGRAVFYIGTVASFSKEKHHVIFDDGDEDDIDLSEEVWRLATQEDEKEARQNDGKVPVKDTDSEPGKASGAHNVASQATNLGMVADKNREAATNEPSIAGALELSQKGSELDPDVVVRGQQFKVREGVCEGKPCYEIYVMVGPMNKEDVKVKCWPEGKVRVMGTPHPGIELWTKDKVEHNIQLPSPIDPYSAKALITLHGLLYISVLRIS
ncbi:probable AT-rich interactive domain-containing protein 3 at C-terminar half [Coccomyxa sp. Obi]|nr:probable AT-rich interactive domain-containing protein 3 at C-terminar half [Coccomyxa sp. Obi]